MRVVFADGDGAVFDRAERPGNDVVLASGFLARLAAEQFRDGVDLGTHLGALAIGRERIHVGVVGRRNIGVGFEIVRQCAESLD